MIKLNPAQLDKYLKDLSFPVDKAELLSHAHDQGADDRVIEMFTAMPGTRFNSLAEVSAAVDSLEGETHP